MKTQITKKNVKDARLVYLWLLFAPIIAVPCWALSGLSNSSNLVITIVAATLPLIFYAPVFVWAFNPSPYTRAHARQGIVLLALRFGCAVLVGMGAWYMLVGNAFLWLVGGLLGLIQAGRGQTWIGDIDAEIITRALVKAQATNKPAPSPEIQYYLNVFRTGDAAAREAAIRRLEAIGQVETF
ncbi:MAG: hypothetical protein WA821_17265 [Anaerolineales bacterium]